MSCREYLHRKTLILGEVHSGKTERTRKILRDFLECAQVPLAVLDLAPEKVQGVGGKIPLTPQEKEQLFYFSPLIVPPRLSGKTEEEVQMIAQENWARIEETLKGISRLTLAVLIINDVSLYLQKGTAAHLLSQVARIPTLVMNGYYGQYFGTSPLSRWEREQMEALRACCDQIIYTSTL